METVLELMAVMATSSAVIQNVLIQESFSAFVV